MSLDEMLSIVIPIVTACSIMCLLSLGLSTVLRTWFGIGQGYASWLLVPITFVFMAMPHFEPLTLVVPVKAQVHVLADAVSVLERKHLHSHNNIFIGLWLLGFLSALAIAAIRELRARMQTRDAVRLPGHGSLRVFASDGWPYGPATVGIFRPRIVLPKDFETRYQEDEQALIVQHEAVHVRRRDTLWNALGSLILAFCWFSPFVHLAMWRFRRDQELACDAAVIHRTGERRTYANALVKNVVSSNTHAAICGWRGHNSMQERIVMLTKPTRSALRRHVGAFLVALCATTTSLCIYAKGMPNEVQDLTVQLTVKQKGQPAWTSVTCVAPGQKVAIPYNDSRNHFGSLGFRVAGTNGDKWRIYDLNKTAPVRIASTSNGLTSFTGGKDEPEVIAAKGTAAHTTWNDGMPNAMSVDILVSKGCEPTSVAVR